jgi:arsenate reductase (thioredoxin)
MELHSVKGNMNDLKRKVLFVCTGNTCRSQMAEGLLREMGGERFEPVSAGVSHESVVNPYAIKVMQEIGLDISGQKPEALETYLENREVSFVIVVCGNAQQSCPVVWPGLDQNHRFFWPLDDPADARGTEEEILAVYRKTRDELKLKITAWLDTLDT